MHCAGILLTGGASRRMGRDKATLVVEGRTLSERAASALASVATPVVEVGPGVSGVPSIEDPSPHPGPLVAIGAGAAAIAESGWDAVIVLACDMPSVTPELLRWLAAHPSPGSVVPTASTPARPQPLCARWSAAALASIPELIQAGERSMRPLLEGPDVIFVGADEWGAVSGPEAFEDVDTPADLARYGPEPGRS